MKIEGRKSTFLFLQAIFHLNSINNNDKLTGTAKSAASY
jgi:hypothetical protein